MRKLVVAVAVAGAVLLAGAPGASGAITASAVTDPGSPTFLDPDTDLGDVGLTVSGTATGAEGDPIDIACALDDGGEGFALTTLSGPLTLAADGTFSATVDQLDFTYYICRLIAVPAGATAPYDVSAFQGPVVGNAGHSTDPIATTGPNAGVLANYSQQQSSPEGYWSVGSAGDVPLGESYPVEPGSLDYHDVLWGATTLPMAASPADASLRVGGRHAYPPWGAADLDGFRGIEDLQHSIEPVAGEMRVTATEPLTLCEPEDTCTSLIDSGVELESSQTGGDAGHTLEVRHEFVNVTDAPKELEVAYRVGVAGGSPGWRMPGETAYVAHAASDTFTPSGTGPDSLFVMNAAGETCADLETACGSLTWNAAPDEVEWTGQGTVQFRYFRTIPAGGSTVVALNYSQGYPQAQVDGYAAAAELAYTPSNPPVNPPVNPPANPPASEFSLGKLTRNKKKGTAKLAVRGPGSRARSSSRARA